MNVLHKLKSLSRHGVMLGAVTATLVGAGLFVTSLNSVAAETYNCDGNSVVYCGASSASQLISRYNNGDGHNSAASIHHIYSWFGISSSEISGMKSTAQMGTVTKSGDVYIGKTLVATNALTAGREFINGSKTVTSSGTKFYTRAPKVSFLDNSLDAYVVMSNGQFKYAILVSCGNPVKATPIPPKPPTPPKKKPCPPNYTISKEVAVKGSNNYSKSVNVQSGTDVMYRITVASTGTSPVTNLTVNDTLPADIQYVGGTLKRDNANANSGDFFSKGINISSLTNGSTTVFTFEAVVGPKDTPNSCSPETLNNVGDISATSLPNESSTATVNKTCLPKPPCYTCNSLTADQAQNSLNDFSFTAKATASNGAVITGYNFNFGDGKTQTVTTAAGSATAQHTYANPGTYNATVAAIVQVNGKTQTVTSAACATSVKVCPPPAAAECTDLKVIQNAGNPREVTATATYTTVNGAKLSGVSFNWGDSATTPSSLQTSATHTYQADGSYTVNATLTFSSTNGSVPVSYCKAPITITTVTPTCDELDIDVNNASKTVTITKLNYTANDGAYEFTTVDWGDSTPQTSAADVTGQTHTYTTDGPFTVVATTHFTVNGQDSGVTSASCQQPVNFTETPPVTPPVIPPVTPPTQLVNTGAGNMVGLFAGATAFGIVGYHWFVRRRLSHEI